MSADARVRYTKAAVIRCFTELLGKMPVSKVTVTEICQMAQINRATFYKHYLDVYDLLDKIEEQFVEELKEILLGEANVTAKDALTYIMVKFKAEEEVYKAVCSENGDPDFPRKLFKVCYELLSVQNTGLPENMPGCSKEWTYRFIAHGCSGVLNVWIEGGMKEPIHEVSGFLEQIIKKACGV